MSDDATIVEKPEAAAPAEPAASAAAAPEPVRDLLDEALAQFDRETQRSAAIDESLATLDRQQEAPANSGRPASDFAPASAEDRQRWVEGIVAEQRQFSEMQRAGEFAAQRVGELEQAIAQMQHQQWLAEERADFDKVVSEIDEGLRDFPDLPANFSRDWLMARGLDDPKLRDAFDGRRQFPRIWARAKQDAAAQLYKLASSRVDRQLSEDRLAVSAAVRGASSSHTPAEPQPDMSHMNNAEYRKYISQKYGIVSDGI
jgi:hypothetical protein